MNMHGKEQMMKKECILFERSCIDCGECSICDLNRNKKCNNCERCLEQKGEYRALNIEDFMILQEKSEKSKTGEGK